MTEYDYSPGAISAFQEKMEKVGSWAHEQRRVYAPGYSNPFQSEDQASSSRTHPSSRQDSPSRVRDRPQPARSRTLPANVTSGAAVGPGHPHGHSSRAYVHPPQVDPRAPRPSTSSSRHRSGSQPPDVRYAYPYPAPAVVPGVHQVVQRTSPMTYAPPAPPGVRAVYREYPAQAGQPIVLPRPRPGETFVIIPPNGGRVDVVTDPRRSGSHSRSQSHSHSSGSGSGSRSKSTSPTKTGGNTLFRKIVTNLKPNVEWGESLRSGRPSTRRETSRRRSTSR